MRKLSGKRVAILVTDGFEQVELTHPRVALEDDGAETQIVSPAGKLVKAWKTTDWGRSLRVDVALEEADASRYDALLLPGGPAVDDWGSHGLRLFTITAERTRSDTH